MKKATAGPSPMTKSQYEELAQFRYRLRRFLRFSEEVTRREGITPLQYQLLLQIKGFPGRDWATVVELAERLQAKHHGVVALVTRCEEAGWVVRHASRDDMRLVEIRLTRKGEQRLEKLAKLHLGEHVALGGEFGLPDFQKRGST